MYPFPYPHSQEELVNNTELVQNYRQQISNVVNQANLQLFWNMYNRCGCSHPPREGARQAAPSPDWRGAGVWERVASCPGVGGSFLPSELRGSRAVDSGYRVLALPHC